MKPILFSTPMVQAILDGRKTMTRRVINRMSGVGPITEFDESGTRGYKWQFRDNHLRWHEKKEIKPPYQTGDILYVRETWAQVDGNCIYRACSMFDNKPVVLLHWRPSIHMPREAARLFLEVKNVRVEQLQKITEEDAKAEGVTKADYRILDYKTAFAMFWNAINGKRRYYSWKDNPWVWVIEFEGVGNERNNL
jgi:hypothetical protein